MRDSAKGAVRARAVGDVLQHRNELGDVHDDS